MELSTIVTDIIKKKNGHIEISYDGKALAHVKCSDGTVYSPDIWCYTDDDECEIDMQLALPYAYLYEEFSKLNKNSPITIKDLRGWSKGKYQVQQFLAANYYCVDSKKIMAEISRLRMDRNNLLQDVNEFINFSSTIERLHSEPTRLSYRIF